MDDLVINTATGDIELYYDGRVCVDSTANPTFKFHLLNAKYYTKSKSLLLENATKHVWVWLAAKNKWKKQKTDTGAYWHDLRDQLPNEEEEIIEWTKYFVRKDYYHEDEMSGSWL